MACGSQSVTAPTPLRSPTRPARSPTPDPPFLQSAGFVLDPGGRAIVSVYSSAASGRLVRQDVTGLIRYLRGRAPPASLMSGSEPSARADGAAVYARVRDLRKRCLK